jgi:AcrR family transcriptional regulator
MTKTASTPILKTPAKTPAKSPAKSLAKRPAATRAARTDSDPASLPEDIRDAVSRLKRERIMAAAVDLFYRQGYGHTTLEQVADALGVTKPFIYAHFASKNELLVEICSRAIKLAHDSLNRALTQEGTASQRLKLVASDFMAAVLSHQAHAVIYSREEKELAQPDRDLINGLRREFDHRLVALIEEGVASGEFQVDDIRMAALAIGGIIGWSQVWFRPNGRLSIAQASESVGDLVLAMVRAQAAKPPSPPMDQP